jgi:mRNA interferase MazF
VERVVFPRRGELYWAALDPAIGTEMTKTRPTVVISNDVGNQYSQRVIIAPLTTASVDHVYHFEVLVEEGEAGVLRASKIALDQIRAVDKRRLGRFLGALSEERMQQVDAAIRLSLAVECDE